VSLDNNSSQPNTKLYGLPSPSDMMQQYLQYLGLFWLLIVGRTYGTSGVSESAVRRDGKSVLLNYDAIYTYWSSSAIGLKAASVISRRPDPFPPSHAHTETETHRQCREHASHLSNIRHAIAIRFLHWCFYRCASSVCTVCSSNSVLYSVSFYARQHRMMTVFVAISRKRWVR